MSSTTKATLAVSLAATTVLAADPLGPGNGAWVKESPAAHGLDQDRLDQAYAYLESSHGNRGCMLVIKDGALVYEKYNAGLGYNKDRATYLFSGTKTLGALLTGSAVKAGVLNLDDPIEATYGVPSPVGYDVTARQIMESTINGSVAGEEWAYDFTGSRWINTLPDVVKATMNESPEEVWVREFVGPLGLSENFNWAVPGGPDTDWGFGASSTCRDYARFGQLILNEGKWAGTADVLDASYVKQLVTPSSANACYGMLTWTSYAPPPEAGVCYVPTGETAAEANVGYPDAVPKDVNWIIGALGQVVMQFPSEKMVVVSMGFTAPRAELSPHHLVARMTEATVCTALPGNLCGDQWVGKTFDQVSGGVEAQNELVSNVRGLLDGFNGILSALVPDELLEEVLYTFTTEPQLLVAVSSCLRTCVSSVDLLCARTCYNSIGINLGGPEPTSDSMLINMIIVAFYRELAAGESLPTTIDMSAVANVLAGQPTRITSDLRNLGVPASVATSPEVTGPLALAVTGRLLRIQDDFVN